MSIVQCLKLQTTQVAGGVGSKYGFTISIHSDTDEFSTLGSVNLDTGALPADQALIVSDFIALVEAALAAS